MQSKRFPLLLAAALVILGGGIIVGFTPVLATIASDFDTLEPDDPADDEQLVMEPHPGSNGEYAKINDDGEIEIEARSINPEARSNFSNVFTILNNASAPVQVTISHENEDVVIFDADATDEFGDIQTEEGIELEPNETVAVGFHIDSASVSAGDTLLESVTFEADWFADSSNEELDNETATTSDSTSDESVPDNEPTSDGTSSDVDTQTEREESDEQTPSENQTADKQSETDDEPIDSTAAPNTSDGNTETVDESPESDDDRDEPPIQEQAGFSGAAVLFILPILFLVGAVTFVTRRTRS